MKRPNPNRLFVIGGISGIFGTLCYVVAITVSMNPVLSYSLAMAWPVFSIIFVLSLYRFISLGTQTFANQLAFLFACLAFTLLVAMISIQFAIGIGINEQLTNLAMNQHASLELMRSALRFVDMGLDVAWDIFIGTSLLFLSAALIMDSRFGRWWGIPSALLGATLIILNIISFPWPPNSRGLFDIGPVIGLYIISLSTRLFLFGRQEQIPNS